MDPFRGLRLSFESRADENPTRRAEFPPCATLVAVLTYKYGPPDKVLDFTEERLKNRDYVWQRQGEALSLRCFRMDKGPRLAEALQIKPLTSGEGSGSQRSTSDQNRPSSR